MACWKNDEEMFALMKEKLYTPVVGDILDTMGYSHQFLPAEIRPLPVMAPVSYFTDGKEPDNRMKLAGFACTVLENDVFGEQKKPFGLLTEALDQLRPNEIYVATGAHNSALWGELLTTTAKVRGAAGQFLTDIQEIRRRYWGSTGRYLPERAGPRIPVSVPMYVIFAAPLKSAR